MTRATAICAVFTVLCAPLPAQGVRISGTTTVDYVDIQPLVLDSVPVAATSDSGLLRRGPDGIIVECMGADAYCSYYRSAPRVSTAPVMQDLELSAWGLGTGISLYAEARARTSFGSAADIWPFADDHFDLISGYAEMDRDTWRARLGRQWITSALGYYSYDGGSVLLSPRAGLTAQLYGGWGLAQGLSEPRTSSLISAVENLPPDDRGYIFGGLLNYRFGAAGGVSVQYQREIRTDFAGLYSERAAAAGDVRLGPAVVDAQIVYDFVSGDFNDARLHAQMPLGTQWNVSAQVRHYAPFFELWTIWGAFSPVGYNEEAISAGWASVDQRLRVNLSTSYRRYGDTDAGLGFLPLTNDGWTVGADGAWRVLPSWTLTGGYDVSVGFGASRSDFDAGVHWQRGSRLLLGVDGTAFQTVDEFSVGAGRVLGVALDGAVRMTDETNVRLDLAVYHHTGVDTPQLENWNQRRAMLVFGWTLGRDPGIPRNR